MWICEKDGHCVDSCEGCEHYVEMVERKRGRWEMGMKCSVCGQVDWTAPNFCPNCGADMREVDHAKE